MTITLKRLDYALHALEPTVSAQTMYYHYGKHYAGYVATLTRLIKGTEFEKMPVEEIVRHSNGKPDQARQAIFNNAAQVANHELFWDCLAPHGGGMPPGPLLKRLEQAFGSFAGFKSQFVEAGKKHFGSGWVWLVSKSDGLHILTTSDAHIPPPATCQPLAVCDLWEHAYYLDYQNERGEFLNAFLDKLINWQFVGQHTVENRARLAA